MNIELPDEREKRESIEYIKKNALVRRKGLFTVTGELLKVFGLRNALFGITDSVYAALLAGICVWGIWFIADDNSIYPLLFIISPFFYMSAYLLSLWKEHLCGTLELQSTCKYTPSCLLAFRMLVFSCISVVADIPALALCAAKNGVSLPRLLLVAFSSLFVYSVLMLALQTVTRRMLFSVLLPAVWSGALAWLLFFASPNAAETFSHLPTWGFAAVAIVFTAVYLLQLNNLVVRGEKNYADS